MKNEIKLHYYTSMLEKKLKEDMARQTQEKTEREVKQMKSSEMRCLFNHRKSQDFSENPPLSELSGGRAKLFKTFRNCY